MSNNHTEKRSQKDRDGEKMERVEEIHLRLKSAKKSRLKSSL